MAAHPILTVDDELLEKLPESFRNDPRFQKGATLELVPVAAANESCCEMPADDWRRLKGILKAEWSAEEYARVIERKRKAQENLDRIYASSGAGATELKSAEREWELADDELDFGPFRAA